MKLTAQEEYGLRCLLHLARFGENAEDWVSVTQVAEGEGLSTAYVEKLLRILSRSRLVESARGAKGGYRLSHPPERISLGAALRALGGAILEPHGVCGTYIGNQAHCVHTPDCRIRPVWAQISAYLGAMLDAVTVADLLEGEHIVRERVRVAHDAAITTPTPLIRPAQLHTKTRSTN